MPYIEPKARRDVNEWRDPENAGELNYALTLVLLRYFRDNGGRYQQINDILGAVEGAKLEFYRRVVVPYETVKIQDNGDVYP